jgi:hypothetical protein
LQPERTVATLVDTDDDVVCGVRRHACQIADLVSSGDQKDNPPGHC